MNERQRMVYTEALGIDTFVPRRTLRLMPLSRQCPLPVAPVSDSREALSPGSADSIDAGPGSVQASTQTGKTPQTTASQKTTVSPLLARIVESTASAVNVDNGQTPRHPVNDVGRPEGVQQQSVSFVLHIWQCENDLLIIDSHQAGDALPTHRLLANIITAFGRQGDRLPGAESLMWPPANTRQAVDRGWDAATELVSAFLDARLQQRPASHLLLFGDAACRSVLGHKRDTTPYQRVESADYSAPIAVMPSLAHLLRHPLEKRDVWLFLQTYFS